MQSELFDGLDPILGAKTYNEFKEALIASACTKCRLSTARQHIVVDRGNPNADVIFIGEGPGENEDIQGKAFVGRAGKLLDQLAGELGFDTNRDSLIINVVKCRPPENRQPKPDEAVSCFPFLRKQIELVRPKFILLLGATALKYIVPAKKDFVMNEEAGKFFENSEYPAAKLMVLFHPAYILRDPRKKPLMTEHLRDFIAAWKKTGVKSELV